MKQIVKVIVAMLMMMAPVVVSAQTENGFKEIAVEQEFAENGITVIFERR